MYSLKVIENEHLRVSVNPIGAELYSIYDKKDKMEMLWQGNSEFWGSRAPVLFPIVGGLKNNTMIYESRAYQMPKHGIVRYNDQMEIVSEKSSSVTYKLQSGDGTLKVYPFKFVFEITFELQGNSLLVKHKVGNKDHREMYFSLGGHPAFNCPFVHTDTYEDYGLKFDIDEGALVSNRLNADGLLSESTRTIELEENWLPLKKNLFDKDALIFKQINSRKVSLSRRNGGKSVVVEFKDFPYLGIWAKPGAPFVCIEPWLGYADNWNSDQLIEHKEAMICLQAEKEFSADYKISIIP